MGVVTAQHNPVCSGEERMEAVTLSGEVGALYDLERQLWENKTLC